MKSGSDIMADSSILWGETGHIARRNEECSLQSQACIMHRQSSVVIVHLSCSMKKRVSLPKLYTPNAVKEWDENLRHESDKAAHDGKSPILLHTASNHSISKTLVAGPFTRYLQLTPTFIVVQCYTISLPPDAQRHLRFCLLDVGEVLLFQCFIFLGTIFFSSYSSSPSPFCWDVL